MDRVRLLIFLNTAVRGGIEEVALALARGLDRERFEIHLAAPPALLEAFALELAGSGVQTFPIHLVSFRQCGAIRRFTAYLRRRRIDIVNSHRFYATLFAAPLARLAGVPVVVETTHGPEAWRKSWWKRRYWVDRLVERFVTANVAVSEANRRYLAQEKRYPPGKLRVVPNGRDLRGYGMLGSNEAVELRRHFGLPDGARVLLVVARLDAQKGHEHLLRALPEVVARRPDIRVLLAGDGPLRDELKRTTAELGLAAHVIFAGFQERIGRLYGLAEFVVLPSLYEGMPLVAIEAGAASRAIVATAVDGTVEVVVDGETGLLVPPRSPAALAVSILRLLDQPGEARRMGQRARRRVERLFSLERQLEDTAREYLELAASRKR